MIPTINGLLSSSLDVTVGTSKNYKMHTEDYIVAGNHTDLQAMSQVIFKILNTERYDCLLYSWNYGIELKALVGEPVAYVCPEAERRITEALLQDERIESVSDFYFDTSTKRIVSVSFCVHTIYGDIDTEKVVNY